MTESNPRNRATKHIKTLLKELTGRNWSVRGGNGTAYEWITARPAARDLVWALPNPQFTPGKHPPKPWPRIEYATKPSLYASKGSTLMVIPTQVVSARDSLLLHFLLASPSPYNLQGVSIPPEKREASIARLHSLLNVLNGLRKKMLYAQFYFDENSPVVRDLIEQYARDQVARYYNEHKE